jgi:hypothetical protein
MPHTVCESKKTPSGRPDSRRVTTPYTYERGEDKTDRAGSMVAERRVARN